jgi:hypothetical protein
MTRQNLTESLEEFKFNDPPVHCVLFDPAKPAAMKDAFLHACGNDKK